MNEGILFHRHKPWVNVLLLGSALVTGCGDANLDDLRDYVANTKSSTTGKPLEPPPEMEPYRPFTYTAQGLKDPFVKSQFAQQRIPEEEIAVVESVDSGVRPDPNRPREELEQFSLGSLKMVGTFSRGNDDQLWALIEAPDGLIYRVQEGNYLGSDHGQIVNITEERIDLTEIVPDGESGWRRREAFLSLAEE